MLEILGGILIFIASLSFVLVVILFGWYIVWKLFLSRFRFFRELFGGGTPEEQEGREKESRGRSKRSRRD